MAIFIKELSKLTTSQSEYISSDVTQIDESVLKTDEAVVPELVR